MEESEVDNDEGTLEVTADDEEMLEDTSDDKEALEDIADELVESAVEEAVEISLVTVELESRVEDPLDAEES